MKKLIFVLPIIALCACTQVPTSRITFGGAVAILPKDASADSLKVRLVSGTNTLYFEATNFTTKNSPAVIGASTDQIKAHYEGASGLVEKAVEGAVKGMAKP